jgi:hypothetical protein
MTATSLQLVRVLVVVAGWSKNLFIISVTFRFFYSTIVEDYE